MVGKPSGAEQCITESECLHTQAPELVVGVADVARVYRIRSTANRTNAKPII